ncbi:MAG: sigma-70 family RNA polymerase sigma factor [Clostridia bacterium]|nr:sigma-70 family RNA polymerase sigma factor [Clostridia bacterium]MBQ8289448.1 sigma-70 family RNA polymerase sigma factor [Clostridia bacterium]
MKESKFFVVDKSLSDLLCMIRGAECQDDAFSELVSRYTPLIMKKVRSFSFDECDEAEAIQEARIALHSAAVTYDRAMEDAVTFGLYANVCITNRLKSLLRARTRQGAVCDSLPAERVAVVSDIDGRLAGRELCERVMSIAKSVLSEFEYEVFGLILKGLKTREIAERLSRSAKSVDNAKARLSRTLKANREICDVLAGII